MLTALPMVVNVLGVAEAQAGLAKMPLRRFVVALACGSIPLAFTFAWVGAAGHENPGLALVLSALLPPVLWVMVRPFVRTK